MTSEHHDDRRAAEEPKVYTAEQVSQGQIVLNTPLRRAIFIGGLAALVVVAIVVSLPRAWM